MVIFINEDLSWRIFWFAFIAALIGGLLYWVNSLFDWTGKMKFWALLLILGGVLCMFLGVFLEFTSQYSIRKNGISTYVYGETRSNEE